MAIVSILSVAVIFYNLYANYRQKRIALSREWLKNCIESYLHGNLSANALQKLIHSQNAELVGVLAQMGESANPVYRARLLSVIPECHCEFIISKELYRLKSTSWLDRFNVMTYLPFITSAEIATQPLLHGLGDEYLDVRIAAAQSLSELDDPSSIRPILASLALQGSWPIKRLIEIILRFDDRAIPILVQYLKDPAASESGIQVAIAVLGYKKASSSISTLTQLTSHINLEIRIETYGALGSIEDASAFPMILGGMLDDRWEIRSASAKALGYFPGAVSISALQRGLTDRVWWVRFNCASSLGDLGVDGKEALLQSLKSPDRFAREISQMILDRSHSEVSV
ncbi:HEAT repeat domain-containing protein [Polynucleobacter sp. JS-Safj-400b-B2]|nr:HEAT repeat domain-containing protein [Polynucleobacter sp. JS-Safj-400b-B2]